MSTPLHIEERASRDARPWLLLIAVLIIALDRVTKILVAKKVAMGSAIAIIPGFFRITHVLNTGAAFSMFSDSASPLAVRIGLIIFSVVATLVVLFMLWRYGRTWSLASIGFALVLGGAIGNLYDRMALHYVIDFLEVRIVGYHWPDFNVADSAISIGAVLLLVEMIWPRHAVVNTAEEVRGA
ncbi:MAG: signal peptidase II [Janthinobacterium lividum]